MVIIKTESQLKQMFKLIKDANTRLLIINGSGGTGKTTIAETELPTAMHIKGHLTPLKLYIDIFNKKPSYLIVDDVDELFKSKIMTSLLKQLTDSGIEKTLSYASTHAKLNGLPDSFDVSFIKGIVIITNQNIEDTSIATLKALMTRALTVKYEPLMSDVEAIAKKFCKPETIKFFNDYLISTNSLRKFKLLDNLQRTGFNLFEQVDEFDSMLSPTEKSIVYLLSTHSLKEAKKKFNEDNVFTTLMTRIKAKRKEYDEKKKNKVI
jgi:hypothetical protein